MSVGNSVKNFMTRCSGNAVVPREYIGFAIGVIGILITLMLSKDVREVFFQNWGYIVLVLICLIMLLKIYDLRRKLSEKNMIPKYYRFEELKLIKYGHVKYYPFMSYNDHSHVPVGIGLKVLEEVFGADSLEAYPDGSNWTNMFDRLIKRDFDIIATPLFETRERSRLVAFSNPLFFADIGVYVRKDLINGSDAPPYTFRKTREQLRLLSDRLYAEVIKGEISEKMANKFLEVSDDHIQVLDPFEANVSELFRNIMERQRNGDIVFAERLFAESYPEVQKGEIINILKPKELLYPVGFAMRRDDYILRNYVNIKLMEMDDNHPKRLMGFILDQLKKVNGYSHINEQNINEYLVRNKDC